MYIIIGVVVLVLAFNQARLSFSMGLLQFSSRKYGFTFFGIDAAAIYAVLTLGAILIIGIGWRGLRHDRSGT